MCRLPEGPGLGFRLRFPSGDEPLSSLWANQTAEGTVFRHIAVLIHHEVAIAQICCCLMATDTSSSCDSVMPHDLRTYTHERRCRL